MKLLIDTHAALWLFNEHENLPSSVREHLLDEANELYMSIASAWEIAIKHSLGKLPEFNGGVKRFFYVVEEYPIELIAVLPQYVETVEVLPYVHRDPFDRIIIATAMCEDMSIVTSDENIRKYNVKCVW
ncbi:MAG: type II toxin-antitoxin system VapC family toxin [Oscillospiraceae bacterium]|jgi:PIN domain nuclease of toxin-antitoxin system|nr:type II toxin-antitoxin system VapC family toxin [Oscillospiraceae bacterium]